MRNAVVGTAASRCALRSLSPPYDLVHELHDRRKGAECDHQQSPKPYNESQALRVHVATQFDDTATKLGNAAVKLATKLGDAATKLGDSATELGLQLLLHRHQIGLGDKLCHDEVSRRLRVSLRQILRQP